MTLTKTEILKNGIRLTSNYSDCKKSLIGIFIKIGSIFENKKNNGVSHFIEHLILNDKRFNGIKRDGFTSREIMGLFLEQNQSKTIENLKKALDVLKNPDFSSISKNVLEKEKKVIFKEMSDVKNNIEDDFVERAHSKLFTNSLSLPILGTKKSIRNMSMKRLNDFYKEFFDFGNINICVKSNLNTKELDKIINKYSEESVLTEGKYIAVKVKGYNNWEWIYYLILKELFISENIKSLYFPYSKDGIFIFQDVLKEKDHIKITEESLKKIKNKIKLLIEKRSKTPYYKFEDISYFYNYINKSYDINKIFQKIDSIKLQEIKEKYFRLLKALKQ